MSLRGALRTMRWRLSPGQSRTLSAEFWRPLEGARALELGGPSACFGSRGLLPVYPVLGQVDGVQPIARTLWHDLDPEDGYIADGERRGALHIVDDVELPHLPDGGYDVVLCSHVIEHIANPLLALAAWRRVTVPRGHLLLVAPHMAGTFDHRRALTPLSHMIEDLQARTGEDDLTHLDEFLRLHDSDRNVRGVEDPDFVRELRENAHTRLLHHHTFTTASLIELLDHAGLQVLAAEARLPHDIYVFGRWASPGVSPDNALQTRFAARHSPFRVDRRYSTE